MNRRAWLRTAGGILAAPAVVRAESIMRVRPVVAVQPIDNMYDLLTDSYVLGMTKGMNRVYDLLTDSYVPLPSGVVVRDGRIVFGGRRDPRPR